MNANRIAVSFRRCPALRRRSAGVSVSGVRGHMFTLSTRGRAGCRAPRRNTTALPPERLPRWRSADRAAPCGGLPGGARGVQPLLRDRHVVRVGHRRRCRRRTGSSPRRASSAGLVGQLVRVHVDVQRARERVGAVGMSPRRAPRSRLPVDLELLHAVTLLIRVREADEAEGAVGAFDALDDDVVVGAGLVVGRSEAALSSGIPCSAAACTSIRRAR